MSQQEPNTALQEEETYPVNGTTMEWDSSSNELVVKEDGTEVKRFGQSSTPIYLFLNCAGDTYTILDNPNKVSISFENLDDFSVDGGVVIGTEDYRMGKTQRKWDMNKGGLMTIIDITSDSIEVSYLQNTSPCFSVSNL